MSSQPQDLDNEWFRSEQRCGVENCRSKRYRRAEDGLLYCSYGHQSDAPHQIAYEAGEYRDASQKVTKAKKDRQPAESAASFFAGAVAAEKYLQCYQGLLHQQTRWLIQQRDMPEEFAGIVRDLWALRLQMLDPLIRKAAEERVESQMHSSQASEDERQSPSRTATSLVSTVRVDDTVGLLYLATLLLQLPIMMKDVLGWIREEAFPYLSVEKYVPSIILRRLPLAYRRTFHNRSGGIPKHAEIHRIIVYVATTFAQSSSIEWPAINIPPLLFRLITEAALPIEVFPATVRLAQCLEIKSSFSSMKPNYKYLADHPEIQLIALLIIVVKLLYPFDDISRPPQNTSEPAALMLNWRQWATTFKDHPGIVTKPEEDDDSDNEDKIEAVDNWNVHEHDVLHMEGSRIDQYLDWFQKTWISDDLDQQSRDYDFQRDLNGLFPLQVPGTRNPALQTPSASAEFYVADRLKRVQAGMRYVRPTQHIAESKDPRQQPQPGSHYKQYRSIKDIPDRALPFFNVMVHLGALSTDTLVFAVFRMERRLRRWDEQQDKDQDEPMPD